MPMEGLKRRLSFRKKKKDKVPECSKPHQWQEDEKKVREGTCSFQVRYLGCVEVFESRGMQVCEEAVKTLKAHCKGKYQRAILYVSGDALRVVDEINKSMIVDQTIEKVSFCAPDRNHEKGFAYICRDGTTRRWMCHGFLAVKESRFWRTTKVKGERLSHAVGCAFAICLERKQKRDKESTVTVTYSQDRTSFERMGSFRQTTMTERLTDPQSAILAEPVPVRSVDNPFALQRPHATQNLLVRQGSFRGFSKLQETTSPFKRTLSLRLNDLPSTLQRQNAVEFSTPKYAGLNNNGVIEEVPSPETEDSISQMCQQLTQGLTAMNEPEDPFASAPLQHSHPSGLIKQHSMPATFQPPPQAMFIHPPPPVRETNPWSSQSPAHSVGASPKSNPTPPPFSTNPFLLTSSSSSVTTSTSSSPVTNGMTGPPSHTAAPHLQHHVRSHSMDNTSDIVPRPTVNKTLLQMSSQHQSLQLNTSANAWPKSSDWSSNNVVQNSASRDATGKDTKETDPFDPFDVAWAAKGDSNQEPEAVKQTSGTANPFTTKTMTTYKMEL